MSRLKVPNGNHITWVLTRDMQLAEKLHLLGLEWQKGSVKWSVKTVVDHVECCPEIPIWDHKALLLSFLWWKSSLTKNINKTKQNDSRVTDPNIETERTTLLMNLHWDAAELRHFWVLYWSLFKLQGVEWNRRLRCYLLLQSPPHTECPYPQGRFYDES